MDLRMLITTMGILLVMISVVGVTLILIMRLSQPDVASTQAKSNARKATTFPGRGETQPCTPP